MLSDVAEAAMGAHDHKHDEKHGCAQAAVQPDAIYTCPMHPQIRQVGPGACPICGMALEPEMASVDGAPNAELADMTRRVWIGLALYLTGARHFAH